MTTGDSSTPTPPVSEIYVYYPYSAPVNPAAGAGQWGEPILVDANGDPIKCPPAYTTQTDPETGKPVVILLSGDEGALTQITPPTYEHPGLDQIYVYYPHKADYLSGEKVDDWGEPILVDADGNPIKCPPAYTTQVDPETGQPVVVLLAGDEQQVTGITPETFIPLDPPYNELYVYWPVSAPTGAGAGAAQWGEPILVDAEGNPVKYPPPYHIEPNPDTGEPMVVCWAPDGVSTTAVPLWDPPTDEVYVYYPFTPSTGAGGGPGQWGEPILVDANGDPIECPPAYTTEIDPQTGKPVVILLTTTREYGWEWQQPDLKYSGMTPPTYTPPADQQVYVYYPYSYSASGGAGAAQWGEPVLVDANGDPIKCPPAYATQIDPQTGKPVVILLSGDEGAYTDITPLTYTPPEGFFVYYPYSYSTSAGAGPGQWGEPILVDEDGNPLKCPPPFTTQIDPQTGKPVVILLEGDEGKYTGITPPTYMPPGTPPPSEEEEEEEGEGVQPSDLLESGVADAAAAAVTTEETGPAAPEPGEGIPVAGVAGEGPEPETPASEPGEGTDVTGRVADVIAPAGQPPVAAVVGAGVVGLTAEVIGVVSTPTPGAVEVADLGVQEVASIPEPVQVAGVVGVGAEEIAGSPVPQPVPEPSVEMAGIVGLTSEVIGVVSAPTPGAVEVADLGVREVASIPEPVQVAGMVGLTAEVIAGPPVPQPVPEPSAEIAGVVGLTSEVIEVVSAQTPEAVEVADLGVREVASIPEPGVGVAGLSPAEIAAIAPPGFELSQETGQVAMGDGVAGELPGPPAEGVVAAYQAAAVVIEPAPIPAAAEEAATRTVEGVEVTAVPVLQPIQLEAVVFTAPEDDSVPPPPPETEDPWHPEDEKQEE